MVHLASSRNHATKRQQETVVESLEYSEPPTTSSPFPRAEKKRSLFNGNAKNRIGSAKKKYHLKTLQLAVLLLIVGTWWAITRFSGIDPVILPSPVAVGNELIKSNTCYQISPNSARMECGVQGYYLWQHLLATVERILAGAGAGIIVGILVGWILASNKLVRAIVEPYLGFLRALPPLGYIGLLLVWFGIGDQSKVILLFLTSFPVVAISTLSGILSVKHDWILSALSLGASKRQAFNRIIMPAALPEILIGIRLALAMTWASVVAAEMNNGIPGIGGLAYIAGTQLETALTIACIIVIGLTAVLMDYSLRILENKYCHWRPHT